MSTQNPADLRKALAASPKAKARWDDLTSISRRDFIRWIESAKQAETRKRRISVTCDKLKAGERRPCCYAVVPMRLYKALGANPKAKKGWGALTANEKRDIVDWIEAAKDQKAYQWRIEKTCVVLTAPLKTCRRGHVFQKTTQRPVCPKCWPGYYNNKK